MKPTVRRITPLIIFVLAILAFIHDVPVGKAEATPPKKKKTPQVKVVKAAATSISDTLELTGSVEPYRLARLASPAEGPVDLISVREADMVKPGQVLVSIGRKKGVDALINSLAEEMRKEEDNLRRTQELVKNDALPGEYLDQARASYKKVKASFIKAEETALDYVIKAPWAGVVSQLNVQEGEFVAPRAALLEMYDPKSLVIRTAAPENYAAGLSAGMKVEVQLDAYPGKQLNGTIDRVYPYLDPRLRTRSMEITLTEKLQLLPGMFARLKLLLKSEGKAITLPIQAIVNKPKGTVVFVVEDGKVEGKIVQTGIEANNRIQILSGIKAGELVIVTGNQKLKNGAKVQVAGGKKKKPADQENKDGAQQTAKKKLGEKSGGGQ